MRAPKNYFFIHIDKKVADSPFKKILPEQPGITYLQQRERIYWGGMGIIRTTLNLMITAGRTRPDYFCLLNVGDFPIKSQKKIRGLLAEKNKREWIRIDRSLTNIKKERLTSHISKYNFPDTLLFHGLARFLPFQTYKRLVDSSRALTRMLGTTHPFYGGLTPYHGSSWWCLSQQCVTYILSFIKENPGYLDCFKYSFAPDEIFFHTIVKQSPFAAHIFHDFEKNTAHGNQHGSHYIDWTRGKTLPRTLVEDDFDDLTHSACMFARKFDPLKSASLLAKLEAEISC